jgi:hypothetical protein
VLVARVLIAPFIIAAVILCCFAAELVPVYVERTPIPIVGPYSLGRCMWCGLELYRSSDPDPGEGRTYDVVVGDAVVRIGWDDQFVVAERHPHEPSPSQPDSAHPEWYIIVVSTGEVHTSYRYETFARAAEKMGVPDTIEMRDARQVYYGGWIPRNKPPY